MKAPDLPAPLLLIGVPMLGLAVNVALQILLGRVSLPIGPVRRQLISFACGFATTAAGLDCLLPSFDLSPTDQLGYLVLHMLTYVFLGFIFFNVINLNVSSLRIRMLKEYLRVHPRPLAERSLQEKYSARGMLDARLERLRHGGQLVVREDRYFYRPGSVVFIGRFFAFLQRFLLRK